MGFTRLLQRVGILLCLLNLHGAYAQDDPLADPGHFDVFIEVDELADGSKRLVLDPEGDFPLDFATRYSLVPANFGDFQGGPHKTDDPGWLVAPGQMTIGETLYFRALGRLQFWSADHNRWQTEVPRGEQVRLFGSVPADVILGGDPNQIAFYQNGTIWTPTGIVGPVESPIEQVGTGGIHTHLDFCVEDNGGDCTLPGVGHTGSPTRGAYLIQLLLFSPATEAGQARYADTRPVFVLLNRGLNNDEFRAAVEARTDPPSPVDDTDLPAAGILIMTGY